MAHTTAIRFEHPKGNYSPNDAEPLNCTADIEIDLYYESPDRDVGMNGGFYLDWEVPDSCPECGHIYTEEEREDIGNKADQAAQDYEPDYPEPDYED